MQDPIAALIMRLAAPYRVFVVIAGAVLIHLSLGTYHTFGNMLPYMGSYMRNYTSADIELEQLIWIPTFQGCFPFAMVIGGFLSNRLGPRFATAIGCAMMSAGVFLSYWTIKHSFWAFLVTYGFFFGFGQGIAYVIAVATVINWAPDKVGLVTGIVAAGFGISSSIFAPIQTKMVNPWNYAPNQQGYFTQKELLDRVPGVFFTLSIVYAIMQTVGLLVICDPPSEAVTKRHEHGSDSLEDADDDEEGRGKAVPQEWSMTTSEMLKSSTFYVLFVALFCCSFYGNTYYNLYKTYGETFIDDDMFLAVAFSIGSVANACARIGWGWLTDKTSFQTSLSTATCLATALLLTMPLTSNLGRYVYLLWLTLMFVCLAATHALFITAAVRCFGTKFKSTNYGCLILSTTVSGIVLSAGSQYLLQDLGYHWAFIITAAFPFTAFILTAMITFTPQGYRISCPRCIPYPASPSKEYTAPNFLLQKICSNGVIGVNPYIAREARLLGLSPLFLPASSEPRVRTPVHVCIVLLLAIMQSSQISAENYSPTTVECAFWQVMRQAIGVICKEVGFTHTVPSVLEFLVERMLNHIRNVCATTKLMIENAARTAATPSDTIYGLTRCGTDIHTLIQYFEQLKYTKCTDSLRVRPPRPARRTNPSPQMLKVGKKRPRPSYIPSWMPPFPDPYTYIKTAVCGDPDVDYITTRKLDSANRRNASNALTNYMLRIHPSFTLLPILEAGTRVHALERIEKQKHMKKAQLQQLLESRPSTSNDPGDLMEHDGEQLENTGEEANELGAKIAYDEMFNLPETESSIRHLITPSWCQILIPMDDDVPYVAALLAADL
ncbi:hypothetical protein QR680_005508 [Steinernema hermaphroditum]|uniref:Transcription initiation factor TFIID subunit 8 n=1 Tax=Steinernema hermaphroditum TaxID=289476 RepID=A0AA39HS97_9BILA|nr:hypothetical protein QR680_005508 [Steinernema hermaphroditum]